MARRSRQSTKKALGPGHRHRNKNPKLSPYQREQKRARLANQAPRPFVNASANSKAKGSGTTADTLNAALMYQKRDAPAKARELMQYLQDKEDRAAERKKQREEAERRKLEDEEEEEAAKLAFRERNENSDDEGDEDEEDEMASDDSFDSESQGVEEEDENEEDDDSASNEEENEDDDDAFDDKELAGALADLEEDETRKKGANDGSDSEIDDDFGKRRGKGSDAGQSIILTHVPKDPSNKQLKKWMIKKEFASYSDMKQKGDTSGCEQLLKKVLEAQGFRFVDPEVIREQRRTRKEQQAAEVARKREEAAAAALAAKEGKAKKKRVRPVLEGELSTHLEDVNEAMAAGLAPNLAAAALGTMSNTALMNNAAGTSVVLDAHAAFAAEAALQNLKLLKKKEKKHAKKSEKRRERTFEDLADMEQKMNEAMSKTHKKKVRKEKAKEGDENYKLHQKLANQQLENLKAGIGAKRLREEGGDSSHDNGHDPNVVLKFQKYEQELAAKKQIKRLSSMDESALRRAVDLDDEKGKLVEKIRFGDRAEAPPVFSVVPSMSNSFSKFAMKLQQSGSGADTGGQKANSQNPLTGRNNKVNGVAVVTSNGGVRAPQNKPGKATALALARKGLLQSSNIVSTAPRTDSNGDISLYERKRLAKLGLMEPVTEQRINRSTVENGGEGNSTHNSKEMELLRQRVMATYHSNKKAARKGNNGGAAPVAAVASNTKSWLPTDRDY